MQLLWKSDVIFTILGAILVIASPETKDNSTDKLNIKKIDHGIGEKIRNTLGSEDEGCIKNVGIEVISRDGIVRNDDDDNNSKVKIFNGSKIEKFSICKLNNSVINNKNSSNEYDITVNKTFVVKQNFSLSSIILPEKLTESGKKIRGNRSLKNKLEVDIDKSFETFVTTTAGSYKSSLDEITKSSLSTIVESTIDKTIEKSYVLLDNDNIDIRLDNKKNHLSSFNKLKNNSIENNQLIVSSNNKRNDNDNHDDDDDDDKVNMKRHISTTSTTTTSTTTTITATPPVNTDESIIQIENLIVVSPNVSESTSIENSLEPSNDITQISERTLEPSLITSTSHEVLSTLKEKSQNEIMINEKINQYLKKDHLKASINLIDRKATKVFYEIKPSLNTSSLENDNTDVSNNQNLNTILPILTTTKRHFLLGFKPLSVPSSFGKFGPYFLDEVDKRNVTERIGNTVLLDCRIGLLGDKKVTWLQHIKDSIRLLTVGNVQYSADERISLKFQYPDNWRLQIAYATLRDSGLYKCQVEIDPTHSLVKRYNVIITAPILKITDDSGRPISGERHLKAGSALRLKCEGRDVNEKLKESLLWTRGDEILTSNVSENRTTEMVDDKEIEVIVSNLTVERATAGNYSCVVPEKAKSTIAVHVLNGKYLL